MAVFVKFIAMSFWAVVAASFLGGLHPAGDSLAVFRVELLVFATVLSVLAMRPKPLFLGLSTIGVVLLGWHIWRGIAGSETGVPELVLYQQNMWVHGDGQGPLLQSIEDIQPDIITLQEVAKGNEHVLEALRAEYPTQILCRKIHIGEAVLTRFPKVEGSAFCSDRDGLAGLQVDTPQGRIWLVSYHVSWPWPFGQPEQVAQILPHLQRLDGPVILGGDFNAVAWSSVLRRVENTIGSRRVGQVVSTFRLKNIWPIGIDHVLAPQDYYGVLQRMPNFASDHSGIVAHLYRRPHE